MTKYSSAGLVAAGFLLLYCSSLWSQQGSSAVEDQRTLPPLDLSDVVIVGVEEVGKPQGRRLRALPATPLHALPSIAVGSREYPETASSIRLSPDLFASSITPFLTLWAGGANHHSADASAKIRSKNRLAQGIVALDWQSQNGALDWMDRHQGLVRVGGSLTPSPSLLMGIQGRLEEQRWRAYGSSNPTEKRRAQAGAGDMLAEWDVSSKLRLDTRLGFATWVGEEEDRERETRSGTVDGSIELHRNAESVSYLAGISGWFVNSKDQLDSYDLSLMQAKAGAKFRLTSRITAGATIKGDYWKDAAGDEKFEPLPEGFLACDLFPLFNLRIQGGMSVSILDISDRWRLNPYLDESPIGHLVASGAPWIQKQPGWVQGEVNRSIGRHFRIRGWGGWEKIEGYPTFVGVHYNGLYSSDPDTIEITRAGLGFWLQPVDPVEISISAERVWGKVIQSTYWDGARAVPRPRSGGVPFLEDGSAQATITVHPHQNWVVAMWGHLHGERPDWRPDNMLLSYGTVGAEVTWYAPGPFMVAVWGDNLSDNRYEVLPGYEGDPFRIGVRLGFHTGK